MLWPREYFRAWVIRRRLKRGECVVTTKAEMLRLFGKTCTDGSRFQLDRDNVPQQFWPLIPYAEYWGIADDWTREELVENAAPEALRELKLTVAENEAALLGWLGGPEADDPNSTNEYVAFTAMMMAADLV